MEYKNAVDRMNEINKEFQTLAKEVATYNQEKVNITNGIKSDQYSLVNDFSLYKNIYGLQDGGVQNVTINGGHLIFNGTRYDSLKNPIGVSELPGKVAEKAVFYDSHNYAMTTRKENAERITLNNAFKDNDAFGAFLLDIPAELEEIRMKEISDAYITAKKDGTLNDKIEGLKSRAIDMIIQAYKDAALAGKARYDAAKKSNDSGGNDGKIYKNTDGLFKNVSDLDNAYSDMLELQQKLDADPSSEIDDYIPISPNLAFRYSPKKKQWYVMSRSGQSANWRPVARPDGQSYIIPNLRDWYIAAKELPKEESDKKF